MNIFGIGGAELILIIIIMLMVAGPKRMIHWSYILGTYIAKLQRMWAEFAAMIQKEMDDAGVDVEIPKEVPNRQSMNKMVQDTWKNYGQPYTQPIEEVRKEMRDGMRQLNKDVDMSEPRAVATAGRKGAGRAAAEQSDKTTTQPANLGTWSGEQKTTPNGDTSGNNSNGQHPEAASESDFGSWSNPKRDE